MYLESMVDGVLKGLGEQLATFRYSLLDSILRITAIWFVVPKYGMMGFLGVMVVSNLMTFCLNMKRMLEQIKKPSPDGGRLFNPPGTHLLKFPRSPLPPTRHRRWLWRR